MELLFCLTTFETHLGKEKMKDIRSEDRVAGEQNARLGVWLGPSSNEACSNVRNSDLPDFFGQTTEVERSAHISLVSTGHVRRTFFERSESVNG